MYFKTEQNVEFFSEGNGEIHLTGYFDPSQENSEEEEDINVLKKA